MRVKTLFSDPQDFTIENYIRACGVDNINEFINPKGEYLDSPFKYENMEDGLAFMERLVKDDESIYLIQDCDVDGIMSASMMYMFLKHIGVNDIKVLFHTNKQHGLSDDIMEQIGDDCKHLIIPDAGTNDGKRCSQLKDKGVDILILDHHQSTTDNNDAIVINNQTSLNVTNKALSGAGVTFKFIQAYCQTHRSTWHTNLLGLVAIANVADGCAMNSYENRTFNYYGLNSIENQLIKCMCREFVNGDKLTPKDVGWSIAPKLNAVCRGHDQELKALIFKGMVGECSNSEYEDIITKLKEAHSEQSNEATRLFNKAKNNVAIRGDVGVQIIENTPYTGLVANKLMSHYNRPIILVHESDGMYIGSSRSPIEFREILDESGCMDICTGHDHSFGVGWDKDKTSTLMSYLDNLKLDIDPVEDVTISVENIIEIPQSMYGFVENYKDLFGTNIPEPRVHIKATINGKNIKEIGRCGIKFRIGMTDIIKWTTNEEFRNELGVGENVYRVVDIVGTLGVNVWNGRETNQIIVDKMEIE